MSPVGNWSPVVTPKSSARHQVNTELREILITDRLWSRRRRRPDWQHESEALRTLAHVMSDSPNKLIDTLLQLALKLCRAGSAGLSLLERTPQGEDIFRWTNLAGVLSKHLGETTPRYFSPCGICLDRNAPQLFSYPARYFHYFARIVPPVVEQLVIPARVSGQTPAVVWIGTHDRKVKFHPEEARIMAGLADFTGSAVHLVEAYKTEQKTRSALQDDVAGRTSQLQKASTELASYQDDERKRIARDLHDSTGQAAALLSISLSMLRKDLESSNPQLKERVEESIGLARQIVEEIRSVSYVLHPPFLDDKGLVPALKWFVEGFMQRSHIVVDLNIEEGIGRLPTACEIGIFRIVQAALINIQLHSGSPVALISICRSAGGIRLQIKDAGKGIPPEKMPRLESAETSHGLGLRGMRERVTELGGTFEIASGGRGTEILIVIPATLSKAAVV
jgi:signal transduction histidine kinase